VSATGCATCECGMMMKGKKSSMPCPMHAKHHPHCHGAHCPHSH
jgi:hypothetical protein